MLSSPRDLLRGMEKLSSVPLVYTKLNEAINSPRSSVGYMSTIISQDPGLSARLLHVVNSAFFGFPRKIDTISRAVIVVGTQQLRDLALATSVIKSFKRIPEKFVTIESFWKHSVACGTAARTIASLVGEQNVEQFFVAGILHDVGRLIIFEKAPEKAEEIFQRVSSSDEPLFQAERNVLGYDHAAVGSSLVQNWKLPLSLEQIIGFHHAPELATRYNVETVIVHLADAIVHAMRIGSSGEQSVPSINEDAWESLGLSLDVLPRLMDMVDRQSTEVFDRFLSE
ncbi:MAG: HDOD domain-containing protein [Ignavibacteriales bacterium]|nr:HDOD domain-containing protein [Ignavibacteriales bacterium]